MALRRKEFYMKNAAAVSAGDLSFPFAETGGPSDLDRRQNFPLRSFKVENKSGVPITFMLDPIGLSSDISFTIPDGKTLISDVEDDFKFSNVAFSNDGSIDINAEEIIVSVRNY
jgi:hypothetical protein